MAKPESIPNQLMPEPCFSYPCDHILSVKMQFALLPLNGALRKADILLSLLRSVEVGGHHGQSSVVIKASGPSRLSALPLPCIRRFLLMALGGCSCSEHPTLRAQFPEWEKRDIGQRVSPCHLSFIRKKNFPRSP